MQQRTQRRVTRRDTAPIGQNERGGSLPAHYENERLLRSRHIRQREPSDSPNVVETSGGVYIISVAARLLNMHPQTLRKYERLGLVTPSRSIGMLRLYSMDDVVRVRLIKYMVDDLGMNMAGVEFALSFLNRIMDLRARVRAMSEDDELNQFVSQELGEMLRELGLRLP